MRTGCVAGVLEALDCAISDAGEVPVSCLSDKELSEFVVGLARLSNQLAAVRVDAVDQAEHVDLGRHSDQRNVANHIAALSNADPAPVRADALLGRWLRDFPAFRRAFERGVLGFSHLDLLRKADNERVHSQMIDDQEKFVRWCRDLAFADMGQLISRWLLGADPDGAEPSEHEKKTGLSVTPLADGSARVSGTLDPLQAAFFRDSLHHEEQQLRRAANEAGVASTVRQRQLSALLNLIGRGVARPDGSMPIPRVNIVMSQKVYEDTAAWLEDPAAPYPELDPNGRDIDKKSQLMDGTPIHPLYGFAAASVGVMRRLVYSAASRSVDVSKNARAIPKWMLEAQLVVTNGRCSNPVCGAPFHWLQADHITPYSHTEDTSVENTRPYCEPENLWKGSDPTRGRTHRHDRERRDRPLPEESRQSGIAENQPIDD